MMKSLFFKYQYSPKNFTESGYIKNEYLKEGNVENAQTSYEKLSEYIQALESRKDSLIQSNKLLVDITKNLDKLETMYIEVIGAGNAFKKPEIKIKKFELYNSFIETFKFLNENITSSSIPSQYYTSLKTTNDLCIYMLSISNSKTKDIEKELKVAESAPEKYDVFKKYMNKSTNQN